MSKTELGISNTMLANILSKTVAIPFLAGLALAVTVLFFRNRNAKFLPVLFPIVATLLYCLLEGLPSIPPIGAKQKIPLLLPFVSVLSILVTVSGKRVSAFGLTMVYFCAATLSILWIGQNFFLSNPWKFAIAEGVIATSFLSAFATLIRKPSEPELKRCFFIPAALSASFGAAVLSALGAFLGMAQANGALAAMLGGIALVSLILQFRGQFELADISDNALLAMTATISLFAGFGVLFAPKTFPAASLLASASLLMPFIVGVLGTRTLAKWPIPLRFLVGGLLTLVPSVLAIGFATISIF